MRLLLFCPVILISLTFPALPARADDETCAACDRLVQVSGDCEHFHAKADVPIQGTTSSDAPAFHEEIFGASFTVTVSRLPQGKYTVILGEAETFFKEPGQRIFNVTCGDTSLAT